MKKVLVLALFGALLFASAHAAWQLQWSDEFNGNSLDSSKWDIEVNCWGGGNAEQQCYTARPENVWVGGGSLHLKPVAGSYKGTSAGCTLNNENSCTWTKPATSGRVRSLKAVDGSWKYGRFEIRAKLPKGDFLWPAIWMLPTDNVYGTWAASGEIDIMEARGQNPNQFSSALHYGAQSPNNKHTGTGSKTYGVDFTKDFHTFVLEWDAKQIKILVDETVHWIQTLDRSFGEYGKNGAPFDEKFHLILNVAIAGGFFNENTFGTFNIARDAPTWTQEMLIDYVRVYKYVDSVPAPTPTPVATPTPTSPSNLQMSLLPVHDSFIDASRKDMAFGNDRLLQLRKSSDVKQGRITYMKFNIPTGGRTPTRASLSLWGGLEEEGGTANVIINSVPSDSWTEGTLTYYNHPDDCAPTTCVSSTKTITTTAGWNVFDVLSIVKKAVAAGAEVVSFEVALATNGHASFNSVNAPSNKPTLSLTY